MKRGLPRRPDRFRLGRLSVLVGLTACFGIGVAAGCFFAGTLSVDAQTHLSSYLNDYFTVLRDGEVALPSLFSAIWELIRWPLLAFFLGFTVLGVPGVPAVFLARGFLLSYSAAVFVRLFGGAGLAAAVAAFGCSCVFSLPALFILGVDAFHSARALTRPLLGEGKRHTPFQDGQFLRAWGCCVLLAAGAVVQSCVMPLLMQAAAGLMP